MKHNDPVVISINISKGGIPKLPVKSVRITTSGLEGDGHNHAKHNSPLQAVCLQDAEKLAELKEKGYELFSGTGGENLTVQGLQVNKLPLGTILQFSGGVVLEISKIRKPCYVMDAIHPKLKDDALGQHGMYARVLKEGFLKSGETINVIKLPQENTVVPSVCWSHTAAIFCGGKSSRMGGKPKAAIMLPGGDTLIEHVYNVLKQLCKEVVLVGHGQGVPDSLWHLKRIQDNYQGLGPIGALEALLSSGLDSEYLISPCDLFKATPELFSFLIDSKDQMPAVLNNKGNTEPLIGRYPASILSVVREHIAQRRLAMRDLLEAVSATSIVVPEEYLFSLSNLNYPENFTENFVR
ncbi:MAG TPA: NTP transferase domain-containing protein [Candidatus Omnitrophota bacterium]|nr:NTP transferase domain-containing protein [Candidatus Omnitrophota bacterium]